MSSHSIKGIWGQIVSGPLTEKSGENMKQQIKVLGIVSFLALSTMNLTACTSEDVALGAGVIIGAVVADGLDSNNGSYDHRNDRDRNHGGGYHHPQPLPPIPPLDPVRPGNRYGMSLNSLQLIDNTDANLDVSVQADAVVALTEVSSEVAATAKHFQISDTAAEKVWSALVAAKQSDFTQIESMGLSHQDLVAMAQGENPSVTSLEDVSASLGLELGETHQVFQQMKSDLASTPAWH